MIRRAFGILTAFLVFAFILISSHGYMVVRLAREPAWPRPWALGLELALWGGLCLLLLLPFGLRRLKPPLASVFAWPGYLWMGLAFYILLLLWASDLVMWLCGFEGPLAAQWRAGGVALATLTIGGLGLLSALRTPAVKNVEVALPRWPKALDGYRVVQLSDIHIGAILQRGYAARLVARCNGLKADLLAITGDLVDGSVAQLREHVAPFASLRAHDGVFFATGNHDHYAGAEEWIHHLEQLGLRVLRNDHQLLQRNGQAIVVAGVLDVTSRSGDDVEAALATAPDSAPRLLLAHHPETFRKACKYGVDLQLSGHTHDGQMWPFRYLVHLQTRFVAGLYRQGTHALYVSRGTGFWGPPLRVLAPPEITQLTLRSASTALEAAN